VTAYYNDIDPFCCAVLRRHIESGELPPGVVAERDIRTVDAEELMGHEQIHLFAGIGGFPLGFRMAGWPDDRPILTAGFPCQPVSFAGKRLGQEDERWLWPEVARVVRVVRPRLVLLENVPGLLVRGMGDVLGDLAAMGYDAEWQSIPAAAVGAPHIRERVFVVAHPDSYGGRCENVSECHRKKIPGLSGRRPFWHDADGLRATMPDPYGPGLEVGRSKVPAIDRDWWATEPDVGRVAHGIPHRVDRLRALGNAVVPQVVAFVARMILEAEEDEV